MVHRHAAPMYSKGFQGFASVMIGSAPTQPPIVASVCISTLGRPAGISRLLEALTRQVGAPPFEVVVVDNDVACTAAEVVKSFRGRLPLSYYSQPLRGLSNARNMTVEKSVGVYLAFIDDDEWPEADWLANLHKMAASRNADAVFGPVRVRFPEGVPDYVRDCWLFEHRLPEHGQPASWNQTRTGNAYVRRAALPHPSRPFGDAFNFSGGEDSDLFKRMIDNGAVALAARDAVVFEFRPRERGNTLWCLRRSFRNGVCEAEMMWRGLDSPTRRRKAGALARRELLYCGKRLIRPKGGSRFNFLLLAATACGRVAHAHGFRFEAYDSALQKDKSPR